MKRYNPQTSVSSSKGANNLRNSNRTARDKIFSQAILGQQTHFPDRTMVIDGKTFRIRGLGKFHNIQTAKERAEVTVEVAMENARKTTLYKIKHFCGEICERRPIDVDLVAEGTPEEIVEALLDGVGTERMLTGAKSIYAED